MLRKDGFLDIKDAKIDVQENVFLLNAQFKLPNGEVVNTGYGVSGSQKQTPNLLRSELIKLGFNILEEHDNKYWFIIKCKKKYEKML